MNTKKVITLGEIMLRLKSPGFERLFQSPLLEATFGGGEANVAVSLSRFGTAVSFVSALPDTVLGDQAAAELKKQGVDTSYIVRSAGRLGVYYLESGANQRPSRVVYDREFSAISQAAPSQFNWDNIFKDASWFHITGITPALSETAAELSLVSTAEAKKRNVTVSVDLNYRKKLWKYGKEAREVMDRLVKNTDFIIANEEDCQKSLGLDLDEIEVASGSLNSAHYRQLSTKVMELYPHITGVAITMRESLSASHNNWSAVLHTGKGFYESRKYNIKNIVDRIGGGDSFAAGLIYGLLNLADDAQALEFAVAASCLKHSIPGDFNLVSKEEVMDLMGGNASGRVQR